MDVNSSEVPLTTPQGTKAGDWRYLITHNARRAMAAGASFIVLNRGKVTGTALREEIAPEELQDLMASVQELLELEGILGGTV